MVAGVFLFVVPWIAYEGKVWDRVFHDWSSFSVPDAQAYILIMGIGSWLFTILSYALIARVNALWMTVASQLGVILQLVIMESAIVRGTTFYSPVTVTDWVINVLISAISLLYIIGQPEDSPAPIVASSLGQFYVRALAEAGAEELLPVARPHSLNQEGYATI